MAEIVLDDVTKVYGKGTFAVKNLNLEVQDGEFMVLVGPSGCGKTTALRCVAGLEKITEGRIRIGDREVNDLEPKGRDIAMVFQNYALYPHLFVYDNMAFGLQLAKADRAEIDRRVRRAAEVLGLQEFLDRRPRALSGGQRQRVAMGRALVREPQTFLWTSRCRTSTRDCACRCARRFRGYRVRRRLAPPSLAPPIEPP